MRFVPSLLTVIGAVWLGWLTFSNMMFASYDWLVPVLVEGKKAIWTEEDVKTAFVQFGTVSRDRVAWQMVPVLMVLTGGIWCGIQAFRNAKRVNAAKSTAQSPPALRD